MARKKKPVVEPIEIESEVIPTFDLGFDSPEGMEWANQFDTAATNYDEIRQSLGAQYRGKLSEADITLKMIQTDLQKALNDELMQHQKTLDDAKQTITTQYASQYGAVAEMVAPVMPDHPVIQALLNPESVDVDSSTPTNLQQSSLSAITPGLSTTAAKDKGVPDGFVMLSDGSIVAAIGPLIDPKLVTKPVTGGAIIDLGTGQVIKPPPNYIPPPVTPPPTSPPATTPAPTCDPIFDPNGASYVVSVDYNNPQPVPACMEGYAVSQSWPSGSYACQQLKPCKPNSTIQPAPNCIKLCEPDCPTPDYDIYCTELSGIVYVVEKGVSPKSTADKLIAQGDIKGMDIASLCKMCAKPPKPGSESENNAINVLQLLIAGCTEFGKAPGIVIPNGLANYSEVIGVRKPDGTLNVPQLFGGNTNPVNLLVNNLVGFAANAIDAAAKVVQSLVTESGCSSPQQISLTLSRGLIGFVRQWLGIPLDFIDTPLAQQSNYQCPTILPSPPEAAGAYLGNTIDEATLECWTRAAGVRYPEFQRIVDAQRTKLSPTQLGVLLFRESIGQQEYDDRIRESGMIRPTDGQNILDLLKQIPTISDIIPMMIRDVEDEINVDWTESDTIFKDKYKGQLETWGEQNGIAPNFAKYAWRAHWTLPSPTQLFEFYRRLRHTGEFGSPDEVKAEIRKTLIQQDILPKWVDYYLAITNNPLTRVDARRSYEIGALTEQGLKEAYLDAGYNDKNAATLVEYNKKLVKDKWLRSPLIKRFAKGEITMGEAKDHAIRQGLKPEHEAEFIDELDFQLRSNRRSICVLSYRKRFMVGELDSEQAYSLIFNQGLDALQAKDLVAGWECERAARGKEIPAAKLVDWYLLGVVDSAELFRRLTNLGYLADDAAGVIAEAKSRQNIRTTKDEIVKLAREKREAEKIEREKKAIIRAMTAAAEKQEAKTTKMRLLRERRQKLLIEAGDKFSKQSGLTIADAVFGIKKIIEKQIAMGISTIDNIYTAAVEVSSLPEVITLDQYSASLADLLLAVEA